MKILTQSLKTGKTDILEVPSPEIDSDKIRVLNEYSLISTGTESSIVNFGKASWIDKAKQQLAILDDICWLPCSEYTKLKKLLKNY